MKEAFQFSVQALPTIARFFEHHVSRNNQLNLGTGVGTAHDTKFRVNATGPFLHSQKPEMPGFAASGDTRIDSLPIVTNTHYKILRIIKAHVQLTRSRM